ncbi:MAG: MarR family transcriptional regulator [Eubacteriales bacterium]|nr:MarR family transcriptional regulator [Eubacteriales bacterium]
MEKIEDVPFLMILQHLGHLMKYQAVSRLEEFELKPSQAGILFILSHERVLSQRELAERIGVKPPSMTVALQKMEKMGYVIRENDKDDMRIIRIALTEKGEHCVEMVKGLIWQAEMSCFVDFPRKRDF